MIIADVYDSNGPGTGYVCTFTGMEPNDTFRRMWTWVVTRYSLDRSFNPYVVHRDFDWSRKLLRALAGAVLLDETDQHP